MNQKSFTRRRDERFFQATKATLQDIEDRLTTLLPELRYAGSYGVLRGYFETLLVAVCRGF